MSYYQVDVICDGALEDTEHFTSRGQVQSFVDSIEKDTNFKDIRVEVYVQFHDHLSGIDDCACSQYETDHHPFATFGSAS